MNHLKSASFILINILIVLSISVSFAQNSNLGIFDEQGDIGAVNKAGSVKFNSEDSTYTVTGGGTNMWFTGDQFHYVWEKMSGDVSLAADIKWIGKGVEPHRKACLVIRQSLDSNSVYIDVAAHGSGLTSLQFRDTFAGPTREVQSNVSAPHRVEIKKIGDNVYMYISGDDGHVHPSGASYKIHFKEPFYVGLGVCSHNNSVLETAVFSKVTLTQLHIDRSAPKTLQSTIEMVAIDSKDRHVVYTTNNHIEAPNISRDGKYILFNGDGHIYTIPISGGEPQLLHTGDLGECNNDHGFSPDGKYLAISDQTLDGKSRIYILPAEGGTPRLITQSGPSYWHGWSPDGKTLAYCGERNGEYDVYTISIDGGAEKRLTTTAGLDDGPDYSNDGKYIYFNSDRTGTMQIYRMNTDGSNQQQITSDNYNNWFAHPSPDGKWIVFLSYENDVKGHPANKDVMIRMMPAGGGDIHVLAKLFGGQGTMNVPSWTPNSASIAFVSYSLIAH